MIQLIFGRQLLTDISRLRNRFVAAFNNKCFFLFSFFAHLLRCLYWHRYRHTLRRQDKCCSKKTSIQYVNSPCNEWKQTRKERKEKKKIAHFSCHCWRCRCHWTKSRCGLHSVEDLVCRVCVGTESVGFLDSSQKDTIETCSRSDVHVECAPQTFQIDAQRAQETRVREN